MNIELINKIKEQIQKDNKSILMGCWFRESVESDCGTAGCIAGWACFLTDRLRKGRQTAPILANYYSTISGVSIYESAAYTLDISMEKAKGLFYPEHWPELFLQKVYSDNLSLINAFESLPDSIEKKIQYVFDYSLLPSKLAADIVCARLDYLVENGV
ncbi:hypothetical protein UFOVP434_94 [uncultured Caudovirales phage]|uniref:Uncharacterized protein n=1 Tax=uncultured Caudovirales phage TaxID=2100421 RepID=A0A6J5MHM6_9CAUD|nr:hypothetical protein UFOVP434_94 [uncultured Caudovirales phage]